MSLVIKTFSKDLTFNRKQGKGRTKGFNIPGLAKTVISLFTKNPNISGRKVAEKLQYSETFVRKVKKEEGILIPKKKNSRAKDRVKQLHLDFDF